MPEINQLSAVDSVTGADQVPIFDSSCGDARKMSLSVLIEYLNEALTFQSGSYLTQYAAPSATGFSVPIEAGDDDSNVHLILTPVAGYAAGTIVLPITPGTIDKQELLVNTTQAVTTLTISGNGAIAVTGAPTTLAANAFFRLKYDLATKTWYRVG